MFRIALNSSWNACPSTGQCPARAAVAPAESMLFLYLSQVGHMRRALVGGAVWYVTSESGADLEKRVVNAFSLSVVPQEAY